MGFWKNFGLSFVPLSSPHPKKKKCCFFPGGTKPRVYENSFLGLKLHSQGKLFTGENWTGILFPIAKNFMLWGIIFFAEYLQKSLGKLKFEDL